MIPNVSHQDEESGSTSDHGLNQQASRPRIEIC